MELTPMAHLVLEKIMGDGERERLREWAGRIAQADGRDRIRVGDVQAALLCAAEEFLPGEGE